jgi:hypothetical protein
VSGERNAVWWAGKWLLQIPIYLVTSYVIRSLIGGLYKFLIKGGANLPPNLLLWHMLWVSIIGGFLAGLIGLIVVRAMLLLPNRLAGPPLNPAWRRPQAWTWVLPTCWLILGVLVWLKEHSHHSALASTSDVNVSDVITAFFGSGCYLAGGDFSADSLRGCMTQLSYTHPWLGTLGYSAAVFVSTEQFRRPLGSQTTAQPAQEPTSVD